MKTRPPGPGGTKRLPDELDRPTYEEFQGALVRVLDKLHTQYHDEEMRRDLETIGRVRMELRP
jgi:hypothetical protein